MSIDLKSYRQQRLSLTPNKIVEVSFLDTKPNFIYVSGIVNSNTEYNTVVFCGDSPLITETGNYEIMVGSNMKRSIVKPMGLSRIYLLATGDIDVSIESGITTLSLKDVPVTQVVATMDKPLKIENIDIIKIQDALPEGNNLIGKVNINNPIPTGSNTIGNVNVNGLEQPLSEINLIGQANAINLGRIGDASENINNTVDLIKGMLETDDIINGSGMVNIGYMVYGIMYGLKVSQDKQDLMLTNHDTIIDNQDLDKTSQASIISLLTDIKDLIIITNVLLTDIKNKA